MMTLHLAGRLRAVEFDRQGFSDDLRASAKPSGNCGVRAETGELL
jgi:hypothetical protein